MKALTFNLHCVSFKFYVLTSVTFIRIQIKFFSKLMEHFHVLEIVTYRQN
jgi:hypothetical protein